MDKKDRVGKGLRQKSTEEAKQEIADTRSIEEMYEEFKKKSAEISEKCNEITDMITKLTGKSPREMTAFMNNPQNFSPAQWDELQKEKDKYRQKMKELYEKLGLDYEKEVKQKDQKKAAKLRSKHVGMRKKNWISVK